MTITAFADLARGTQQALFTNVLSDDTVKRMNILGLQDVNAIIEAFQPQVCGSSSIFVYEYKFQNRSQGTNKSFEEFCTDLQALLNKCHYEDCCKTETRMSCKERILLATLVADIRSNEVQRSVVCIKDVTLEKAVQHVEVDEATSFQANQFSSHFINSKINEVFRSFARFCLFVKQVLK